MMKNFNEAIELIREKPEIVLGIIPNYFTDIKPSNFGFIDKQLVAVDYDYSIIRFADIAMNSRMRSAKDLKIKE